MERTIAIRIDNALHKRIKMRVVENGVSLKDYIICLIENDLKECKTLDLGNISADDDISEESIKEAQKVLDFVSKLLLPEKE
jgi:hypothetical protein